MKKIYILDSSYKTSKYISVGLKQSKQNQDKTYSLIDYNLGDALYIIHCLLGNKMSEGNNKEIKARVSYAGKIYTSDGEIFCFWTSGILNKIETLTDLGVVIKNGSILNDYLDAKNIEIYNNPINLEQFGAQVSSTRFTGVLRPQIKTNKFIFKGDILNTQLEMAADFLDLNAKDLANKIDSAYINLFKSRSKKPTKDLYYKDMLKKAIERYYEGSEEEKISVLTATGCITGPKHLLSDNHEGELLPMLNNNLNNLGIKATEINYGHKNVVKISKHMNESIRLSKTNKAPFFGSENGGSLGYLMSFEFKSQDQGNIITLNQKNDEKLISSSLSIRFFQQKPSFAVGTLAPMIEMRRVYQKQEEDKQAA